MTFLLKRVEVRLDRLPMFISNFYRWKWQFKHGRGGKEKFCAMLTGLNELTPQDVTTKNERRCIPLTPTAVFAWLHLIAVPWVSKLSVSTQPMISTRRMWKFILTLSSSAFHVHLHCLRGRGLLEVNNHQTLWTVLWFSKQQAIKMLF